MPALNTPPVQEGWHAPDFSLKGTDGKMYTLADLRGPRGLVVMFICNHCPFVQAVAGQMVRDMRELAALGVGAAAVMPNDTRSYPEDSFENMQRFAQAHGFTFPYLIDQTQDVAKAYGAVCTPDFFGFDGALNLRYRGRIDATTPSSPVPGAKRELFEAMVEVAKGKPISAQQRPSIGCSIKWRT